MLNIVIMLIFNIIAIKLQNLLKITIFTIFRKNL